jgi:Zn-dependent protease with chaperone function
MQSINGVFYNGTTAGVNAYAVLTSNGIEITYIVNGNKQTTAWNYHNISRIDAFEKNKIQITYWATQYQTFEVNNEDIIDQIIKAFPEKRFLIKRHYNQPKKVLSIVFGSVLVVLGILASLYFFAVPAITEKFAEKIPMKYEKKIGEQIYNQTVNNQDIDTLQTTLSQTFFDSLHFEGSGGVKVTVVKSDEVNAYALPGEYIVVHDSIIKALSSADEYAALLAHEYSHIKFRHSMRGMINNLAGTLIISILLGDSNGVSNIILNNAHTLKTLQFSRKLEREADEQAVVLLTQSNLDPNGMIKLFETLQKQKNSGGSEFISTHPLFKTRLAYLKAKIGKTKHTKVCNESITQIWNKIK